MNVNTEVSMLQHSHRSRGFYQKTLREMLKTTWHPPKRSSREDYMTRDDGLLPKNSLSLLSSLLKINNSVLIFECRPHGYFWKSASKVPKKKTSQSWWQLIFSAQDYILVFVMFCHIPTNHSAQLRGAGLSPLSRNCLFSIFISMFKRLSDGKFDCVNWIFLIC